MTGLRYVYAVCRPFDAALQAQLTGVAGDPPKLLAHHGLVAVVSTVPERDFAEEPLRRQMEDLDWLTATARAHQARDRRADRRHDPAAAAARHRLPGRQRRPRDDGGTRGRLPTRPRPASRAGWSGASRCTLEKADGQRNRMPRRPPAVDPGRDYLRQRRRRVRTNEDRWQQAETFAQRTAPHPFRSRRGLPAARATELRAFRRAGQNVLNAAYLVPR